MKKYYYYYYYYYLLLIIIIFINNNISAWSTSWRSDNELFINNSTSFTLFSINTNYNLVFQLNFNPGWSDVSINIIDISSSSIFTTSTCLCQNNLLKRWTYWSEPLSMLTNIANPTPINISTNLNPCYSQKISIPYDTCNNNNNNNDPLIINQLILNNNNNKLTKWPVALGKTNLLNWWFLNTRQLSIPNLKLNNIYTMKLSVLNYDNIWKQIIYNNNIVIQDLNIIPNTGTINISDEWILLRGQLCDWLYCFQTYPSKSWNDNTNECV